MSINACTINNTTIDSICVNRRNAIIQTLQGIIPVEQSHVNISQVKAKNVQVNNRWNNDELVDLVPTYEQDYWKVTVTIDGKEYSQTLHKGNDNFRPLISINSLKQMQTDLIITISDIKIT